MNPLEAPDLTDAMARLEAAEAAEATPNDIPQEQVHGDEPANPPEQTDGVVAPTPNPLSTDTPAAADPKPAEPASKTKPPVTDKGSAFSKDKQRRDDSWKKLNADKAAFEQERQQYQAQKQSFERQQEQFKVERAKANQKFTPEQYEQAAQQRQTEIGGKVEQAEAWQARADQLEGEGKFAEAAKAKAKADELREEASTLKVQARQFKDTAAHLRANPDPTLQQVEAKRQHELREYTLAAVGKWPEFGKDGGEFQKKVAQELQTARQGGLEVNDNPQLLYHAARLVAAETASARVPGMEKELGELRAKVKDLEALTAPGGGSGSVQRQPTGELPKTDADEEAELRAMAATF